jgi:hypothetical protein
MQTRPSWTWIYHHLTAERRLTASPDYDCRIITGCEKSDMFGMATSEGDGYPVDFPPGFNILFHAASCDWFLRLGGELLM